MMKPTELNLSGTPAELTLKAFYLALSRYESPLPAAQCDRIQEIAQRIKGGDKEAISQLRILAENNEEFYPIFQQAYLDLRELDAEQERDKCLPKLEENEPFWQPDGILENLLAGNSQDRVKQDRESKGGGFLRWLSRIEIKIRIKS
ncbi:hypothetical protein [Phormidium sp. CCY1219]|uniref:hypothetical protein n=1 Tax=Phormidium sp. CCY1219 TaxID=2886104 RepID=UPI002D1EA74E|nr:hypothetical protein [Phormidium sp. CCY1219]MEB3830127.1 hypothetical protein [Phormidium sp. CCY1219]